MPRKKELVAATSPTRRRAVPSETLKKMMGKLVIKVYILDTNVLMNDPLSLFRFVEHDVYVPMMTLEELDGNKQGRTDSARNARQASRMLDTIAVSAGGPIAEGIDLHGPSGGAATGRLFLQTETIPNNLPEGLPQGKADNQILNVVIHLQNKYADRPVILVSRDINMRIKAKMLGLMAQDYLSDKVLEDTDVLPTGALALPPDFWSTQGSKLRSSKAGAVSSYEIHGPTCSGMTLNQFLYLESIGDKPFHARVRHRNEAKQEATIETIVDYQHARHAVWGITARNREQNFALNLLMDPEVDFVMLLGQAGTGKTLLTLAAALQQTLETKRYSEIVITRVTVPVGEDIGFLPGTEEEKMTPWMGALEDNLDVLNHDAKGEPGVVDWGHAATMDLIRNRIKVKSLNFMRGRTFLNKFLIIDEAQNLTPKQMKTLITRAGPGTKVVCLGNLAQIDTPYVTEGSSGLTYAVERFKGWEHSGHITLQRGERSRLADHAVEVL